MKITHIIIGMLVCALPTVAHTAIKEEQQPTPVEVVAPETVGLDSKTLSLADSAINQAISVKRIPGAVLCVVRHGKIGYLKAYGYKRIYPKREPMTTETVFDLASVTKPVTTATCAMRLIESGKLRLQDAVQTFIPKFENWRDSTGHTKTIRIINLLTHTSGLLNYDPYPVSALVKRYGAPSEEGLIDFISHCKRQFAPGEDCKYSCLNYITLQYIIEKITGKNLQQLAHEWVFDPLGMAHTDFNPSKELAKLCAPTVKMPNGKYLQGVARDSLARVMMGGVAGNAGLFSTATDLAVYCATILNGGTWKGYKLLSPAVLKCMTTEPTGLERWHRTPGWAAYTPTNSLNGDLLSHHSFGHSGDTGSSVEIDPDNDLAIILFTNTPHPDGKGSPGRLRALVANIVASSIIK